MADSREKQLEDALRSMLAEWDKFTRYGSSIARSANTAVAAARVVLNSPSTQHNDGNIGLIMLLFQEAEALRNIAARLSRNAEAMKKEREENADTSTPE